MHRAFVTTSLTLLAFAIMLAGAKAAEAHFVGNSWEYLTGKYLIDVGYDTNAFSAGSYVRFDFALKDAVTKDPSGFSSVWVRMVEGKEQKSTILATGIHRQEVGPTTLLFVFPKKGEYSMEASFRNAKGEDMATTSFPIVVEAGPGTDVTPYLIAFIGVLAGATAHWAAHALRRRKRSHDSA